MPSERDPWKIFTQGDLNELTKEDLEEMIRTGIDGRTILAEIEVMFKDREDDPPIVEWADD